MMTNTNYVTALRFDSLTRYYDALIRGFLRERQWKGALIEQARLRLGMRVLDVGSGTGTLALRIKSSFPDVDVVGIDGDNTIVQIAREKAAIAGVAVTFDIGVSYNLPYASQSFDRVVCSLMLHHLTTDDKVRTAREMYRVLRHGGELHVADWGQPKTLAMEMCFSSVRMLDGMDVIDANAKGLLPELFAQAGFNQPRETMRFPTIMGALALFEARKPL